MAVKTGKWLILMGLGLVVLVGTPAIGQSNGHINQQIEQRLGSHNLYQISFSAFQNAVRDGRKADVAAFVRYPLAVSIAGHKAVIRSAREFIERYDAIMTPGLIKIVTAQAYKDLSVSAKGVSFDAGAIELRALCVGHGCQQRIVKITAINPNKPD